jgi:putative membrane protein
MERSNRTLWIGLGVVAVVLLFALPSMGAGMMFGRGFVGPGAYGFGPHPFLWGFWGIGLLARLLFFGLIAYLAVRLFRGRGSAFRGYRGYYDEPQMSDLTPLEILRRRYASGEISREQYEDMRRTLEPTGA